MITKIFNVSGRLEENHILGLYIQPKTLDTTECKLINSYNIIKPNIVHPSKRLTTVFSYNYVITFSNSIHN